MKCSYTEVFFLTVTTPMPCFQIIGSFFSLTLVLPVPALFPRGPDHTVRENENSNQPNGGILQEALWRES